MIEYEPDRRFEYSVYALVAAGARLLKFANDSKEAVEWEWSHLNHALRTKKADHKIDSGVLIHWLLFNNGADSRKIYRYGK